MSNTTSIKVLMHTQLIRFTFILDADSNLNCSNPWTESRGLAELGQVPRPFLPLHATHPVPSELGAARSTWGTRDGASLLSVSFLA